MYDQEEVISQVVERVRPAVLAYFTKVGSCVVTTRVAIDVLEYFGVRAKPLPVRVMIYNPEAYEMLKAGKSAHEVYEESLKYDIDDDHGPWPIGVGVADENGNSEAGHVVAYLPDHQMILDLSIDQMSRPQKDCILEPLGTVVTKEFVDAPGIYDAFDVPQKNGAALLLYEQVSEHYYRDSPNWHRTTRGDKTIIPAITASVINDIKAELDVS